MLQVKIDHIARLVRSLEPVDYPATIEPSPCGTGVSPVEMAAMFTQRLNALRAPGDTEPAVLHVTDANEASRVVVDLCRGVPPDEIVWPADPARTPPRCDHAVGITPASTLIAATGSVILESPCAEDGYASLLVDRHIVVASQDQLVADLPEFYRRLSERLTAGERLLNQVCITGCSRTADIEKLLVIPAHGPHQVRVILSRQPIYWPAMQAALS